MNRFVLAAASSGAIIAVALGSAHGQTVIQSVADDGAVRVLQTRLSAVEAKADAAATSSDLAAYMPRTEANTTVTGLQQQITAVQAQIPTGIVKAVAGQGPDSSGNVAGIATTPMVQAAMVDQPQVVAPSTGNTVAMANGASLLIVNSATLLATLNIVLPPAPVDGQRAVITTTNTITAVQITGGTVRGGITTLSASGFVRYVYSAAVGAWVRTG
jgi:hypothetical protein